MNASASMARPNTLTVMWRIDQAPRPDAGGASGASPMSNASPRSPVASGPVNTPTADARNRPSLAACSATRNKASMDSVGATPRNEGSRATPNTWAASPRSGTANRGQRTAGRSSDQYMPNERQRQAEAVDEYSDEISRQTQRLTT